MTNALTEFQPETPVSGGENDLRQFLTEINRYPLLSREEELALARRCAQGDEEAIRQMVNANMRLVIAIARRYHNGSVPLPDMIQEGAIGLMAAVRKFDPERDIRFSTYASKWIKQSVIRYVVNHSSSIRVPPYMVERIRQVTKAQTQLRQSLDREPTAEEIGQICQLSADRVAQLLQIRPQICSLEAVAEGDAKETQVQELQMPQPQEIVMTEELVRMLEKLLAMLPERQQRILRLRFGLEDGKEHSLEEIGGILGISKERVRQIEQQSIRKLKKLGANVGLEDFLE